MRGVWRDMVQVQVSGTRHKMVRHRQEGLKGLFLSCNFLWFYAASQLQRPGFDSRLGSLSVWSLHALPVSAWVSSRSPKDVLVRWISRAKLPLSVRGISRGDAWGCGNRAWMGL